MGLGSMFMVKPVWGGLSCSRKMPKIPLIRLKTAVIRKNIR